MSKSLKADHQPASNTEAVATISNGKNYTIKGRMVHYSYSAAPTGGKLTIKSGTTVISEVDVTAAGPGHLPLNGFDSTVNETLSATLAAGGVGVSGKVSISGEI